MVTGRYRRVDSDHLRHAETACYIECLSWANSEGEGCVSHVVKQRRGLSRRVLGRAQAEDSDVATRGCRSADWREMRLRNRNLRLGLFR